MRKVFIDAGYYAGKALEYYAPFLDDSWDIVVFEPNPEIDVEASISRFKFKDFWLMRKAIWTRTGKIKFRIDGREDAAHVDNIRTSDAKAITVECIDFSRFIKTMPPVDKLVCSMDIEGAEFPVLRKMLKEKTIDRFDLIDIEFHHRLMPKEDSAAADQLRRDIEARGVLVKLKLEL